VWLGKAIKAIKALNLFVISPGVGRAVPDGRRSNRIKKAKMTKAAKMANFFVISPRHPGLGF
jgi:hypothetical protein